MKTNKKLAKNFFKSSVNDYKKEFYESGYNTFMSVRLDSFLSEVDSFNLPKLTKCLDAGCGPGYLAAELIRRDYKVSALDSSDEMLRLTQERLRDLKLEDKSGTVLVKGDIEELPFDDGSFDLIASAGVIEYLPTDKIVLSEFYRVLNGGGFLILSTTNKISPAGYLEPLVEAAKRNNMSRSIFNWFLVKLGGTPVRAREFMVRKHAVGQFKRSIQEAGFEIIKVGYFYALPFPHPFDRIFPKISSYIVGKLDKVKSTKFRRLSEGIYVVAKKK